MSPIVILGGGQAGGWAARELRQLGYDGHLILVGEEPHPPYERPSLSKGLLIGSSTVEKTYLFEAADWAALNVKFISGKRVVSIDAQARRLRLSDGNQIAFRKLLVATGSRPKELRLPGVSLPGIYYLRTIAESLTLAEQMRTGGRLLIVGAGWIGLEVAAAAHKLGQEVVVVEASSQACSRVVDDSFGQYLASVHHAHGVDLRVGTSVKSFRGSRCLEAAQLTDGTEIEVSAAVIGIGATPNTELATDAGLAVCNGILVNGFGQTSNTNVYAAGDVASYPEPLLGRRIRLESWENAQNHGISTARSILSDDPAPYSQVPWFWSDQYDLNIQIVGLPSEWDRTVVRGTIGSDSFCVCYVKDGHLQGAVGVNRGREIRAFRRLMQAQRTVDPRLLGDDAVRVERLLKSGPRP